MIWQIVKKQGLLLLRNPQQLLLLIGLPIILIAILGTALSGMMEGTLPEIHVKVGWIDHEDEAKQIDRFMADLEKRNMPKETIKEIQANIAQMAPVHLLKDTIFGNENLKKIVQVDTIEPSEKKAVMKDDAYDVLIEVPENFTYETLAYMVLNGKSLSSLKLIKNEGSDVGFAIVDDILHQFQEQLTLDAYLKKKGLDPAIGQMNEEVFPGQVLSIDQKNPVTAKGYYAVGMAVMNVLFIASTIGRISFMEKRIHVFDRVILANVSRWIYFIGVFISNVIFSFMHLLIIFGFARLAFGVSWPNILSFFVVTGLVAVAVGGLGVLLSAISYRLNSETITGFFGSMLVSIMAFLGGSFFPIGDASKIIRILGDFTPNGAGMSAYLAILRGDTLSDIHMHLIFLILFAVSAIILAAFSFPKRGASI